MLYFYIMKKIFLTFAFLLLPFYFSGCSSVYNPATGKEESIFSPTDSGEKESGQKLSKSVEKEFKSVDNFNLQARIQKLM